MESFMYARLPWAQSPATIVLFVLYWWFDVVHETKHIDLRTSLGIERTVLYEVILFRKSKNTAYIFLIRYGETFSWENPTEFEIVSVE